MAKQKNSSIKILGLILAVVGVGLAYWGYQASESITSQISETFTGTHTDKVMMFYIGGAASFVVGLYLFVKR